MDFIDNIGPLKLPLAHGMPAVPARDYNPSSRRRRRQAVEAGNSRVHGQEQDEATPLQQADVAKQHLHLDGPWYRNSKP